MSITSNIQYVMIKENLRTNKMVGRRYYSHRRRENKVQITMMLWPPAAATSKARFTLACPRTSA